MKGHIAILSPLVVANWFVQTWPPSNICFLRSTWVSPPCGISICLAFSHTPQQRLKMLVKGADNVKNCRLPSIDLDPSNGSFGPRCQPPKRHLNWFSWFCRARK